MADHKVTLTATEGIFKGLAKQNMLFHQCLGELVDNAISAKRDEAKFHIDVILVPDSHDTTRVDIYVADNCKGMSLATLGKALQLGEPPTTESRLNEHGFGLKNALATLSGGNGWWKIWTKPIHENTVYTVEGPFRQEMVVRDGEAFPTDDFLPADFSTLIRVPAKISFVQTIQGRGAPAKDLVALRNWLIEHLGVAYRGYLLQDKTTFDTSGVIVVSIGTNRLQVPPIEVPIGNRSIKYLEIELSGQVYKLEYEYGTLDEVRRDNLVRGDRAKYYYQGNICSAPR